MHVFLKLLPSNNNNNTMSATTDVMWEGEDEQEIESEDEEELQRCDSWFLLDEIDEGDCRFALHTDTLFRTSLPFRCRGCLQRVSEFMFECLHIAMDGSAHARYYSEPHLCYPTSKKPKELELRVPVSKQNMFFRRTIQIKLR